MENINCPYCRKNESSKTSFAHHVCDKDALRQRIDGLEAHAKMWHRESLRLAAKHSEDVFYYHGSPLEDDARLDQFSRLIACWNACEGISTEALESDELREVMHVLKEGVDAGFLVKTVQDARKWRGAEPSIRKIAEIEHFQKQTVTWRDMTLTCIKLAEECLEETK